MKRTTFNVSFYIKRTRLTKKGEAPILLRVTSNGTRAVCALPLKVKPDQWNATEGKSTGRDRESKELNLHLDTVRLRIMQIHREVEFDGKEFTAQVIINKYQGKDAKPKIMLMEAYQEHNERCHKLSGIDIAAITIRRYEV